jgi:uncharacterized repeat protein (TIGR03803 family)
LKRIWVTLLLTAVSSQAQTFTTLVYFDAARDTGAGPYGTLVQPAAGNFYGVTFYGGASGPSGVGTIFEMTPAGTLSTIVSFNSTEGDYPEAGLVESSGSGFFGTTSQGGTYGLGTVFGLNAAGAITTLHSFNGPDGENPDSPLIQATNGVFYGVTPHGGANNYGAIFKITPAGTFTLLHNFKGSDGYEPNQLMQASDGNLYGTTIAGGDYARGTIFRITLAGALTVLHSFDITDGEAPAGGLVQDAAGTFYGTTSTGGADNAGTIFAFTPGSPLSTLHSFDGTDGDGPSNLILATDGNLYGTALFGGASLYANGTVFRITLAGTLTLLHSFQGPDGAYPMGVMQGADGSLYGMTYRGGYGQYGYGTVFRISVD